MWYVWLQSVTGDWTVTMRQSSLALYWFRFLNFCLIKQNFVWCGVPQQMWASQPDQLFHLWWLPNCPPIFNLLGQRKNSHTVSYKDANFYCILRKSGGGKKVSENWQVLLFHAFRLSLQGFSVDIDSRFSEVNSKLTIGDLSGVVWKAAAEHHSVFKSGLEWHAIRGKFFWLCCKNHPSILLQHSLALCCSWLVWLTAN